MRRTKGEEVRESATYAKAKGEAREKESSAEGRVPKLRFPEFANSDNWPKESVNIFFDLNDFSEKASSFDKDKILSVRLHGLGVIKNDRTQNLSGGTNYLRRKGGQFVFSKIDLLNGAFGIIPPELDGYYSSSDIPAYTFKKGANALFFAQWLLANYKQLNIERTGTSSTLRRVSRDGFLEVVLCVPSGPEQQKIAACLSSLDDLIAAHARKLEALRKYKKGLMLQLFPAEGEKVPRLRFPEFRGSNEWQERSLVNCIKAVDAGVSANCYDYPARNSSDIGVLKTSCSSDGVFMPNENKKVKEDERTNVKTNPLKNTILICRKNTQTFVGESCFIKQDYMNLFLPDLLWRLTCNDKNTDAHFFSYYLQLQRVRSRISNSSTGSSASMKNISQSLFLEMKLCFPSLPEQQKIAACLSSLDDLIAAQTAKVEELKEHKRGLMQGLFPSPEEEG